MRLVTAIQQSKRNLKRKVAQRGDIWENFGQDEVRRLEDKYIDSSDYSIEMNKDRDRIKAFSTWCMNFSL